MDAISGAYFPAIYAVPGPDGLVDGRDGATLDLDIDQHELAPDVLAGLPGT